MIEASGVPWVYTSANKSGRPAKLDAESVLAELGPERFCAAIDYSIGQNWSGIFEQPQQPQRQPQPSRAEQRQAEMLEQERRMLRR